MANSFQLSKFAAHQITIILGGYKYSFTIVQDIRPGRTLERDIYPTRTNVCVYLPSGTSRKGYTP
ncbi:hypothetical protein JW998_00745 [candidate division KSB1 bacterium]|nr:hypothetical protein [candidate division KSB1 bacterium]